MKADVKKVMEAKDLTTYKRLLRVLGDYCTKTPGTGVDRLFNIATDKGKSIMPSDKRALAILSNLLGKENTFPQVVQQLLNMRFSSLPIEVRPLYKDGRKTRVASWSRGANVSDRVKDLVNWDDGGGKGQWTDIDGKKVSLIDMTKEDK